MAASAIAPRERLTGDAGTPPLVFVRPSCQVALGSFQLRSIEGQMERGIKRAVAAALAVGIIAGCGGANESSTAAAAAQDSSSASGLAAAETGTQTLASTPPSVDQPIESGVDIHDAVT